MTTIRIVKMINPSFPLDQYSVVDHGVMLSLFETSSIHAHSFDLKLALIFLAHFLLFSTYMADCTHNEISLVQHWSVSSC